MSMEIPIPLFIFKSVCICWCRSSNYLLSLSGDLCCIQREATDM